MKIGHDEVQMFELFAAAAEQLNDYTRSLHLSGRFFDVRTRADIRNYQSGWRLEKWIEADIQQGGVAQGGSCATWWLEMGPSEPSGLILEGFLYVNPDGCDISLPIKTAETLSELKQGIATVLNELQTALDINQEFIQAIESARSQTNR